MSKPRMNCIMPNVTRKDGIPITVTKNPFMDPTINPEARPATTANGQGKPACIIRAQVSAERAAVEPTDRSNSPADMTKVMATAITVTIAVVRAMLNRLVTDKNPLSPIVIAKNVRTTAKKM